MEEVQSYCDNVVAELSIWKAKINDVVERIDKVSSGEKAGIGLQVSDLHMLIEEIENRTDRLREACPIDYKPEEIEMRSKFTQLQSSLDRVWQDSLSPGDIGG